MPNVKRLLGRPTARPSTTASCPSRSAARRARPSSPASTRTTTACSRTSRRTAATTRWTARTRCRCGCKRAGYDDDPSSASISTATAIRDKREIPPGWTEWHGAVDNSTYQLLRLRAEREREARAATGATRRRTRRTSTRDKAVEIVRRRAGRRSAVLPLGRVRRSPCRAGRRHPAARADDRCPRRGTTARFAASPAARRRRRSTRRTSPTSRWLDPQPRPLSEADRSARSPSATAAARVAPRRRRGGRPDRRGARREQGELSTHADRLHVRQRLPPGRAPDTAREGGRVRPVDACAADRARPGRPGRRASPPAGGQHRSRAHDRRCRERAGRTCPMDGRSLWPLFADPGIFWGRDVLHEAPGLDAPAEVHRHPYSRLALRRVSDGREGALRPRCATRMSSSTLTATPCTRGFATSSPAGSAFFATAPARRAVRPGPSP